VWFARTKEVARETCWRSGWWVWIDVPEDTPEYRLNDGEVYRHNFALKITYVNALQMTFEAGD